LRVALSRGGGEKITTNETGSEFSPSIIHPQVGPDFASVAPVNGVVTCAQPPFCMAQPDFGSEKKSRKVRCKPLRLKPSPATEPKIRNRESRFARDFKLVSLALRLWECKNAKRRGWVD
jgi:hypothetical protein